MRDREKNVICPLCQEEGKRVEMERRDFSQKKPRSCDRYPGTFVKMHNPVTRKFDLEIFAEPNLRVNWKCPACEYDWSE